ncbi:response regulator [Roseixanthobacter glucoisosaccharinicivorans]|uniref:response regulator n=1 Tax=Roseixanthobacter glucoisosaccharinicivorans TaxID=3119923 RepID=UPI003727F7A6
MILSGKRILVAEDEMLVGLLLEQALLRQNCTVLGPMSTLAQTLEAARTFPLDAAILDRNLRGEDVLPAAELLFDRGIPVLFCSGYGQDPDLPAHLRAVPVLHKPYLEAGMIAALSGLLRDPGRLPSGRTLIPS